jgi:acetate---CoA ligase (ADP-forming) subunit beta
MLTGEMDKIIEASKDRGWVLEPEAKRLFALLGMDTPRFTWASRIEEAVRFADEIGYPVACKVVSPEVLHKSDAGGVAIGVASSGHLTETFNRFSRIKGFAGMLVEEMIDGIELIVGAKIDDQFGPVILLGIGGTGVEIYQDVTLKMAPLDESDIESMTRCLKAHRLLEGYRGSEPIDFKELTRLLLSFSGLVMNLADEIESIDLNPVICSSARCVVADARIMLAQPDVSLAIPS